MEVSAQAWDVQFVACLEIKTRMNNNKRIIQSCRTSAMHDLLLPYTTSSLFLSSLNSTNSPLSLPLLSLSLPLLLLALEYFTYYLHYTFAMHYTHAEVPGSSDTSGDSGGRRPRRRSEIQCNITIRKKAIYRITFLS